MAINGSADLTHIIRSTKQWADTFDKSEIIPGGVLCVEFTPEKSTLIKIGDGHHRYADLPYVTGTSIDLSDYYTKEEVDAKFPDNIITIKGLTNNSSNIPETGDNGDLWFVENTDKDGNKIYDHYIWYDGEWRYCKSTSGEIDIREYVEQIVNEFISALRKAGELHIHKNKKILDDTTAAYTKEEKEKLKTLENYDDTELRDLIKNIVTHSHDNKEILDRITAAFTTEYEDKLNSLENYDDTAVLKAIEELQKLAHSHDNKDIIDKTTAVFTKEYEFLLQYVRLYTGATPNYNGIMGLVPPAERGQEDYILNGAGEWVPIEGITGGISDIIAGPGIETEIEDEALNIYKVSLKPATEFEIGGVIPGAGLIVDENGVLSIKYDTTTLAINENNELVVIDEDEPVYLAGEGITIYDENEYDEISYVESTGSQYILLDYYPKQDTRIITDFEIDADNNENALWGTRIPNEQFILWMYNQSSKLITGFVYGGNSWDGSDVKNGIQLQYPVSTRLISEASVGGLFINDDKVQSVTNSHNGFGSIGKLCIFGANDNDAPSWLIKAKIYNMKIYEGSELIIELIPRIRNSDNTVGLYDIINEVFYPSETSNFNYDTSSRVPADNIKHIISVKPATKTTIGGIKVGEGLEILEDGTINVISREPSTQYTPGTAIDFISGDKNHKELDCWNSGADWSNLTYDDATSTETHTYQSIYHSPIDQDLLFKVPYDKKGAIILKSTDDNDLEIYFDLYNSSKVKYDSIGPKYNEDEVIFPSDAEYFGVYVAFKPLSSNISINANDITEVTFIFEEPSQTSINVKHGDGLAVNDDNKLEVKIGNGLRFDENGVIVMDSSVNVNIKAGSGIDITKDEETQESIINIKYSEGLNINDDNELFVDGKENTIRRFTKAEYDQAVLDGTAPKPGELFVITDDYITPIDPEKPVGVTDVVVDPDGVGKLKIYKDGEVKIVDIFEYLEIMTINCVGDGETS